MHGDDRTQPRQKRTARLSRRDFLKKGAAVAAAASSIPTGVTILSSCGTSGSSGPLQFWNFYSPGGPNKKQAQWFHDLASEWNKNNKTQVQLVYLSDYMNGSKLQTSFASGKGPDIFLLSPGDFARYYNGGVLADLTPHMSKDAIADYYPSVLGTRKSGNKIYGLPMEVEPMAFYYSVDAFQKAGLSEADVPKTWSELASVATKLKTANQFGIVFDTNPGYYQNFTWYPFLWETGNYVVKSDNKSSGMSSAGAVEALRLWQDVVQSGAAPRKAQGTGGNDIVANLSSGYAAMVNCGIWGVSLLRDAAPNFKFGVFTLPAPPTGSQSTVLGGWAFVANAKSPNADEAAKFCAWALGGTDSACIQRGYDWIGSAKSDVAPRKAVMQKAQDQGLYASGPMQYFKDRVFPAGRGEPRFPPQVYKAVSDAVQAAQLGGTDPKQAGTQAAQTIEQFLSGYHGLSISDETTQAG